MTDALLRVLSQLWGEPQRLLLLFGIPLVPGLFLYAQWQRERALSRMGNPALLKQLSGNISTRFRWLNVIILTAALTSGVLASARPQWGTVIHPVEAKGVDIVILLDTSLSMLAEDIKPNRLVAAKDAVSKFVGMLSGDRVALVPFAGGAFVQCPLTADYSAVDLFLREISTRTIPDEGTNLAMALEVGLKAFAEEGEGRNRAMIVISDGEAHDSEQLAAVTRRLHEHGIRVSAIGMGTSEGELIPISTGTRTEFLRDENGHVVKTRLDEQSLRQMALETGGAYYRASPAGTELRAIFDAIGEMERTGYSEQELVTKVDRYQWPLGLSVVLALLIPFIPDRRRKGSS